MQGFSKEWYVEVIYPNLQHFIKTKQFFKDFSHELKLLVLALSEYLLTVKLSIEY